MSLAMFKVVAVVCWILGFVLIAAPYQIDALDLCAGQTNGCELRDMRITLDAGISVVVSSGNLTLINTTLVMNAIDCWDVEAMAGQDISLRPGQVPVPDACTIVLNVTGPDAWIDLRENSLVFAPSLIVLASSGGLRIGYNSLLEAVGPKMLGLPGCAKLDGCGGGHAGEGALSYQYASKSRQANGFGSLRAPWSYGGVGTAMINGSMYASAAGGGRVYISLRDNCEIIDETQSRGGIVANGASPHPWNDTIVSGGGAGGTVVIRLERGRIVGGTIQVIGMSGSGRQDSLRLAGGGGSGGRFVLHSAFGWDLTSVFVGAASVDSSRAGAAGIKFQYTLGILRVDSDMSILPVFSRCKLLYEPDFLPTLNSVYVSGALLDLNNDIRNATLFVNGSFSVNMGAFVIVTHPLRWQVGRLELVASAVLKIEKGPPAIISSVGDIVIDDNSQLQFRSELRIMSEQGITAINSDVVSQMFEEPLLVVIGKSISFSQSVVSSYALFVHASESISISDQSEVSASSQMPTQYCSVPVTQHFFLACREVDKRGYVVLSMHSKTIFVQGGSGIKAATIALCATNITIQGTVVTDGEGCPAGGGKGKGGAISKSGGGGGHAGRGGYGIDTHGTNSSGGKAYDAGEYTQVGSGGGHPLGSGTGGGLIYLEATNTLHIKDSTSGITADGGKGKANGQILGGGGSGGVLRLNVSRIIGSGTLSSSGGNGVTLPGGTSARFGSGGGGGGYVVRWNPNSSLFVDSPGEDDDFRGQLLVSGGSPGAGPRSGAQGLCVHVPECQAGRDGISCNACPAGQNRSSGIQCRPCPVGTFAATSGAALCEACPRGHFANVTGLSRCHNCTGAAVAPISGMTSCSFCPAGTFAESSDSCANCPAGMFSVGHTTQCSYCPGGFAPSASRSSCTQCEPGTFRSESPSMTSCLVCSANTFSGMGATACSTCALGTASESNQSVCHNCPVLRSHASYHMGYGCVSKCDPGFISRRCVTPFERLVESLGGPVGFSFIILGATVALSSPFVWCWLRARRSQKSLAITDFAAVERQRRHKLWKNRIESGVSRGDNIGYHALNDDSDGSDGDDDYAIRDDDVIYDYYIDDGDDDDDEDDDDDDNGDDGEDDDDEDMRLDLAQIERKHRRRTRRHRRVLQRRASREKMRESVRMSTEEYALRHDEAARNMFDFDADYRSVPLLDTTSDNYRNLNTESESVPDGAAGQTHLGLAYSAQKAMSISTSDLPNWVDRVYFDGANSAWEPTYCSGLPPKSVEPLMFLHEFAQYADRVSTIAEWNLWEKIVHSILLFVYFPLSSMFLTARRAVRLQCIVKYHTHYDHALLHNYSARALCNSLKFGHSRCLSLLWVDVMTTNEQDIQSVGGASNVGMPRLPTVFVCAGDGSYANPFELDITDVLLKSMAGFFGHQWFSFVVHLNSRLRCIDMLDSTTWQPVMEYLEMMSHTGIGIGAQLPDCGVFLELGFRPSLPRGRPDDHAATLRHASCGSDVSSDAMSHTPRRLPRVSDDYSQWDSKYRSDATLDTWLVPGDPPRAFGGDNSDMKHLDPETNAECWKPTGYRPLTQYADNMQDISDAEPVQEDVDRVGSRLNLRFWRPVLIMTHARSETPCPRNTHGTPNGGVNMGHVAADDTQDRNVADMPHNVVPARDVSAYAPQTPVTWMWQWLRLVTLHNVQPFFSRVHVGVVLAMLLLANVVLEFAIANVLLQFTPTTYVMYVLTPPLTNIAAPICGLGTMVTSHSGLGRVFVSFNVVSILNCVLILIVGGVSQYGLVGSDGIVLPLILIGIKVSIVAVGSVYVAHLDVAEDFTITRRDYLINKSTLPSSPLLPKARRRRRRRDNHSQGEPSNVASSHVSSSTGDGDRGFSRIVTESVPDRAPVVASTRLVSSGLSSEADGFRHSP